VSGEASERVVLVAGEHDPLHDLVRTLATIERGGAPFALVGGLAVMARLGQRHRATEDVDTAFVASAGRDIRAVIVAAGGSAADSNGELDGVRIDTIAVEDIDERDALPDDIVPRAFVTSHLWALRTATTVDVTVSSPSSVSRAEILVATKSALIATKLGSYHGRWGPRRDHKRATDLDDLFRLLATADGAALEALAVAPFGLGGTCAELVNGMLGERRAETISQLRRSGDVTLEQFDAVARAFLDVTE